MPEPITKDQLFRDNATLTRYMRRVTTTPLVSDESGNPVQFDAGYDVVTINGPVKTEKPFYVALDADGYPYPFDVETAEKTLVLR